MVNVQESQGALPKVFFPSLDGLRFVAFFFVYLEHAFESVLLGLPAQSTAGKIVQTFFLDSGELGVSVFFVLSGFLITYLLLIEVRVRGRLDVGAFYVRRALRIWPLYYAAVVFSFFLYPWIKAHLGIHSPETPDSPYYFAFLSNFAAMRAIRMNYHLPMFSGVLWSVAIEEQFYLVWPLLFFFMPKSRYPWIFSAMILASLCFRILHAGDHGPLYFHSLSVSSDLAVGGLAAYGAVSSSSFRGFFEDLPGQARRAVYALGLGAILLWPLFLTKEPGWVMGRVCFGLFFAFVVLDQSFNRGPELKLARSRFMSFWGKYTYGLYLLHPIALMLLFALSKGFHAPMSPVARDVVIGVLGFGFSLMLSYASYHLFESRFLRMKKRFSYVAGA
jgi:peptidoglycan/LPS O-acetylase OafA/YrhL